MKTEILIAYYSWHGNTKKIAELIKRKTGGFLFEIEPEYPYTADYDAVIAQAKKEIKSDFKPELKNMPENASYTTVFLGTPIWWNTMAPPVSSFIDRFDLNQKIVIPFYTHGGGGGGSFENDVAKMCPKSKILKGFGAYNSGGPDVWEHIGAWLKEIGEPFF